MSSIYSFYFGKSVFPIMCIIIWDEMGYNIYILNERRKCMAKTIEDMINDIVHEQVDQVIDEKVEDHHKIEDLESRVASLEERIEDLLEAIRSEYKGSKLEDKIKHI